MDFNKYLDHHYALLETLVIQLSLRCPLRCSHCNVNAGPDQNQSLSRRQISQAIDDFAANPEAKLVFLTGGEPFTEFALLRHALEEVEKHGLLSYVITSASWANDKVTADRYLAKVPQISLMSISVDKWHGEYLPIDNAFNAAQAALDVGTAINFAITTEGSDDPFPEMVAKEADKRSITATHYVCPVARSGRSTSNANPPPIERVPMGYCAKIGAPTLTSDGSVIACCCSQETNEISQRPGTSSHSLRLGHVEDGAILRAKEVISNDPLLRAIRLLGPGWIWQHAHKHGLVADSADSKQTRFRDICHVCEQLVRDPEVSRGVRELLQAPELSAQVDCMDRIQAARR